jgi:hypothetical protein
MADLKLRDLSRWELSNEDYPAALLQLDPPDVPDMTAAILGAALVEYALEQDIKRSFKNIDSSAWRTAVDRCAISIPRSSSA